MGKHTPLIGTRIRLIVGYLLVLPVIVSASIPAWIFYHDPSGGDHWAGVLAVVLCWGFATSLLLVAHAFIEDAIIADQGGQDG
jgi:hypothetical protein